MGENGAWRTAAQATVPPIDPDDSTISATQLTASRSAGAPTSTASPTETDWAHMATAPTLLATPVESAAFREASTTSPSAPPTTLREGAHARRPPSPRVLRLVAGIIAACVLIVVTAGAKLLYQCFRAPPATPALVETSPSPAMTADLTPAAPAALGGVQAAELSPRAPGSAPTGTAAPTEAAHRTTTVRPSPARPATKTTTRVPPPKKTGRGAH